MSNRIYVGNLSYSTTEEGLRAAFASDGREVLSVSIITDRMSGRPRGFAFVEMASSEDAQKAVAALDGQELDGRTLKVSEARERTPDRGPPRPRSGGGGPRHRDH